MFAAVWLGYAGDRWFDAGRKQQARSERHDWYNNRKPFVFGIWLSVLIAAVVFSFNTLNSNELLRGGCLTAASILYTVYAQNGRQLKGYVHAKNLFIAILITASSALFVFERIGVNQSTLISLVLATALFFSNCQYIRFWGNKSSFTKASPISIVVFLTSIASIFWIPEMASLSLSVALSVSVLWALNYLHNRIDPTLTRTLADIALLSPFAVLPFS